MKKSVIAFALTVVFTVMGTPQADATGFQAIKPAAEKTVATGFQTIKPSLDLLPQPSVDVA